MVFGVKEAVDITSRHLHCIPWGVATVTAVRLCAEKTRDWHDNY